MKERNKWDEEEGGGCKVVGGRKRRREEGVVRERGCNEMEEEEKGVGGG